MRQVHKWLQRVADSCPGGSDGVPPHLLASAEYARNGTLCGNRTSVQLVDLAYPGIIPLYSERCLVQKVPPDVSIVFFELCVSDTLDEGTLNTSDRRALETMLRYVLELPSQPALVFVCMYRMSGECHLAAFCTVITLARTLRARRQPAAFAAINFHACRCVCEQVRGTLGVRRTITLR